MDNTIIIAPARMGAARLPGKPLAPLGDAPLIVHVWRRAKAAMCGPVVIAADGPEIANAVRAHGGRAVETPADLASGTDRVAAALARIDPHGYYARIVNVQGDMPFVNPDHITAALALLDRPETDIGAVAVPVGRDAAACADVVKVVVAADPGRQWGRALYFTRARAPWGDGPLWRHIGIYAFRRAALARFVALAPSPLEQRERLEQLRALEAGMRIDVALAGEVVDALPVSVDTPADLEAARAALAALAAPDAPAPAPARHRQDTPS